MAVGAALFWAGKLLAQPPCTCVLAGRVHDGRNPVAGAVVQLESRHALTDSLGRYRFSGLCRGQYTLVVRHLGFERQRVSLQLDADHQQQGVALQQADVHLHDVVVTARRNPAPAGQSTGLLQGAALQAVQGRPLADALRQLPGVAVLATGGTIFKPVIRGLHSSRVVVLTDGLRLEGQQWGSEHAPEMDPFAADRLVVVRGAVGVAYGPDALGGVVRLEAAPLPTQAGLHGRAFAGGMSNARQGMAAVELENAFKNGLSGRLVGSVKRGGTLRSPGYFQDNTGLAEGSGTATFGYRHGRWQAEAKASLYATRVGIFSGSHIGNLTDLQALLRAGRPLVRPGFSFGIGPPYQAIRHGIQQGKATYTPRGSGRLHVLVARQLSERAEYDLHTVQSGPALRFRLQTFTAEARYTHRPLGGRLTGQLGFSGQYQHSRVSGRLLIPGFRQGQAGLFLLETFTQKQTEIEAGLRYDVRQLRVTRFAGGQRSDVYRRFARPAATLSLRQGLGPHLSLRAQAGTAWRSPHVSELYSNGVHHGAAAYETGDSTLQPETALHLEIGLLGKAGRWQGELSLYRNAIGQFIYLEPLPDPVLTVRGAFPAFQYRQTPAVLQGLEAAVHFEATARLSLHGQYTLVRGLNRATGQGLLQLPPDRFSTEIQYKNQRKVGGVKGPYAALKQQFVARQTRVPAGDYAPPPPAYWLWEAAAGGYFSDRLKAEVRVSNLLNARYRDYLDRFRYFLDAPGRNLQLRVFYGF